MKDFAHLILDLDLTVKRLEEFRHRVAFLKADNRLTEFEKMAKAKIACLQSQNELTEMSDKIKLWLDDQVTGGKGAWNTGRNLATAKVPG